MIGEFHTALPSLRALYHLSDTSDSSGNGFNLTNTNSVGFVPGLLNNCADFGASNTNKALSRGDGLTTDLSGNISWSFWVKIQTAPASNTTMELLEHYSLTGSARYMIFAYQDSGGTKQLFGDLSDTSFSYPIDLGTQKWHNIWIVYATTPTKTVYLNGIQVAQTTNAGTTGGQANFYLANNQLSNNYASVFMDELAIFTRAWGANEIKNYYAWTVGRRTLLV